MTTDPEHDSQRLETVVALLIALVTVIGAVVAWRASVAGDGAGDADTAGIRATLNASETGVLSTVDAYADYSAFTQYQQYLRLRDTLWADLEAASEEEAVALSLELENTIDRVETLGNTFDARYADTTNGTYDAARQTAESRAREARDRDLEPQPHFAEGDALRTRTNDLLIALVVLSVSLVFFTLVESVEGRGRLLLVALGVLFMVTGTVMAVVIEMRVI